MENPSSKMNRKFSFCPLFSAIIYYFPTIVTIISNVPQSISVLSRDEIESDMKVTFF